MQKSERLKLALSVKDEEVKTLKAEIESLRATLAALTTTPKTPLPKPPKDVPFRFLDLPFEMRDAIYECCLITGTVYLAPRTSYDHRYDGATDVGKPAWSLLQVNRQVRKEAAKVLLSKNHFVLGANRKAGQIFWSSPPYRFSRLQTLSLLARRNLTSISITFDIRNLSGDILKVASTAYDHSRILWSLQSEPDDRTMEWHSDFYRKVVIGQWSNMLGFFLGRRKLLQVDITNAFCPLGCCRLFERIAEFMGSRIAVYGMPEVLEILGTKSVSERSMIKDKVKVAVIARCKQQESDDADSILRFKAPVCKRYKCLGLHMVGLEEGLQDEEIHTDIWTNGLGFPKVKKVKEVLPDTHDAEGIFVISEV